MIFVDTHTHLYDSSSIELQDKQIEQAMAAGVKYMYMPSCDKDTFAPMMAIAERFPDNCFPMLGLHPCYVKEQYREELSFLEEQLERFQFAAIGEIGLDFYWDRTFAEEQKIAFERQIDWAIQLRLPIVIHSRSSTKECIDIIKRKQNGNLVSIFHCYSGTLEEARQVVDLGGYIGIGGVVTYKKSSLPGILNAIPIEHIVLETDAPYLSPVPHRGKPNESAYLPLIAQKVAEIYALSIDKVAEVTSKTALKIFSHNA